MLLFLHSMLAYNPKLLEPVGTHRDRAAHLQRLPHKELGALAHHHGASWLHSHGPGNLEHVD